MNSIILDNASGLINGPKVLEHLHLTLKAQVGDKLRCTVLNDAHYIGEILSLCENNCTLNLTKIKDLQTPWFNLIVGLSRPQTTKKILEHATTYGAESFHFYKATLSEKSYLDSKVFKDGEGTDLMRLGLSQSTIYGRVPLIKLDKFNPAAQYEQEKNKFILDLNAEKNVLDYKDEIDFNAPIYLAIGPERGYVKEDLERFYNAGFKGVKISSSVLRVEHAIYSSIAQFELIRGKY